jgi:hypothetical protein
MPLRYGDDEAVAAWAAERLGIGRMGRMASPFVRPFVAIGVERDGILTGALVFTSYTGPDIELTLAGRGCWSRSVIRAGAHYVFRQLGCLRVSVTLRDASHEHLAVRLGFEREGYARDKFGPGRDGILMGMLVRTCKWI